MLEWKHCKRLMWCGFRKTLKDEILKCDFFFQINACPPCIKQVLAESKLSNKCLSANYDAHFRMLCQMKWACSGSKEHSNGEVMDN